jgi:hypothetical protein
MRPARPARNTADNHGALALSGLLYRYLFFGWLFADLNLARNVFELRAAWQHNRAMRKYLPVYLKRWAILFALTFSAGWVCEVAFQTMTLAACCYAGSCITVPVMVVIVVAWIFLARPEPL